MHSPHVDGATSKDVVHEKGQDPGWGVRGSWRSGDMVAGTSGSGTAVMPTVQINDRSSDHAREHPNSREQKY